MRIRKHLLIFFSVFLGLLSLQFVSAAAASGNSVPVTISGNCDYAMAYDILDLTNQLRVNAGRTALAMDGDLMEAAMERAAEIRLIFDHSRPDKSSCLTILPSKVHGENLTIAYGWTKAQEPVDAWHASEHHYANLLTENYRSTGIGCFRSDNVVCCVQLFSYKDAEPPVGITKSNNVPRTFRIGLDYQYLDNYGNIVLDRTYYPSSASHSLKAGETKTLKLQFFYPISANGNPTEDIYTYPHNYMDPDVSAVPSLIPLLEWSDFTLESSDPNVLAVDDSGRITAKKAGTVTIRAKHRQVTDEILTCQITVSDDTASRSVCFRANGGSLKKTGKQNQAVYTYTYNKKYGSLPGAYRKGYSFDGWYTAKNGGSKVTKKTVVRISKNTTQNLYAHWSKIKVSAPTIRSVSSPAKGRLKASWKKVSGVSGYQLQVSTSAKFGKKTENTITLKGAAKTSNTVSGLKKRGTKYYVRVRAYQTDSCGKKVYSKYSKVLSVKVKK